MNTSHTPGPWAVSMPSGQTAFNGRRVTVTANGSMIADLDWNSPMENLANAALIAAAPQLRDALAALQGVAVKCEYFRRGEPYHHLIEQARVALTAARAAATPESDGEK